MINQKNLVSEAKSGKVYPAYLLLGEDKGGKDEFVNILKKQIFSKEDENTLNVYVYYGDETSIDNIVESLRTFSFFSAKKLIILYRFDKLKNIELLYEYLESPNIDSIIVLVSERKFVSKSIEDAVSKVGRSSIFWPMFVNESKRWVSERLRKAGVSIEHEAIDYIIEVTGTNKNDLATQIESILSYIDSHEILTFEKARDIVSRIYSYTVFDLCNALFIKKRKDIVSIFRFLLSNGEDMVKIEYFIGRELQKLFTLYTLMENGYDFPYVVKNMNLKKKEAERLSVISQRVGINKLKRLFSEMADLDYKIKTIPREIALINFENFIIKMGI